MRSRSRTPRKEQAGSKASEAYAWHFDMLHDASRVSAFCDAFGRLPLDGVGGLRALDLGCGSGVLGLALLRRPEVSFVEAFEVDADLAQVAARNAAQNGLQDRFRVHAVRSTTCRKPPGARAQLVVAEILDAGLLGEDCLKTMRHAADRLLLEQYLAVPARAEVFACGVESATLASWQTVDDAWWAPRAYAADEGDANPHDVVLEKLVAAGQARVLTEEFHAQSFNFEQLPEPRRCSVADVRVVQSGRLDAIVFWWCCYMVRGDKSPSMTNAPSWAAHLPKREEIDHWRQAVCILPRARQQVLAGEKLRIATFHTDEDIWFRVVGAETPVVTPMPRACSNLALMSPCRLWMLADPKFQKLQHELCEVVKSLPASALVLDLSDGPFTSLLAARALLRRGPKSRQLRRLRRLAERGDCLLSCESTEDLPISREVLGKAARRLRVELTTSPRLGPGTVALLCGEPFLRQCEGQVCDAQLWQHWAQVDALRWCLARGAVLLPGLFRVRAVLLACPALWRRRQRIRAGDLPVDVSAINELHPDPPAAWRSRFPCGLWQVDHAVVSAPTTLCQVDLAEPLPRLRQRFQRATLTREGDTVHGLATWTEVWLGGWVPTAQCQGGRFQPGPAMQGVLLAQHPGGHTVAVDSCFKVADGSLYLQARWVETQQVF
ncbi:unnamed protein product [Effrenium voratum]|nr:unnamed protein product [Effrenium voratum]